MTKTRFASLAVLVGLLSLTAARVDASLVLALDMNELTKRADHIAVADVLTVRSAWDDRHAKIYTTIELSVVESWTGGTAPASRITIVQPGGTVGDVAMVVFGLSQFTPGERALFFLRGRPAGAGIVGMAQGKRPMRRDASSGQWMVDDADRSGLQLVTPTPAIPSTGHEQGPRLLDEMRGQVRQILKGAP
jgi:hypothetical protein